MEAAHRFVHNLSASRKQGPAECQSTGGLASACIHLAEREGDIVDVATRRRDRHDLSPTPAGQDDLYRQAA